MALANAVSHYQYVLRKLVRPSLHVWQSDMQWMAQVTHLKLTPYSAVPCRGRTCKRAETRKGFASWKSCQWVSLLAQTLRQVWQQLG